MIQARARRLLKAKSSEKENQLTTRMRNDAPPPNLLQPHLLDQPRDGMKGAAGLERTDLLLVLAFHPDPEPGHAFFHAAFHAAVAAIDLGARKRRWVVGEVGAGIRGGGDAVQ